MSGLHEYTLTLRFRASSDDDALAVAHELANALRGLGDAWSRHAVPEALTDPEGRSVALRRPASNLLLDAVHRELGGYFHTYDRAARWSDGGL